MTPAFLKEREDGGGGTPHLSFSRLNRYLTCPEQYRLYYIEMVRPKTPSSSLVFGNILHQALAAFFLRSEDPVGCFGEMWGLIKEIPVAYGERDSWDKLRLTGESLLKKFEHEEGPRLGAIQAVEKPFTFAITGIDRPMVGIIDLVAELDGTTTVIDFKTASSSYGEGDAVLSDQLTVYRLAEPEVEQLALCVLVKTKQPRIEWHLTARDGSQLTAYLAKIRMIVDDINAGKFFARSGPWCAWCDYRPLCVGNATRAAETLVRIR